MIRPRRPTLVLALTLASALTSATTAQWPHDPSVNLPIVNQPGIQTLPKIAVAPDGSAYVGWFDTRRSNHVLYLQRLDPDGHPQWSPHGLLISDHPQCGMLMDWSLTTDAQGNAVLTFSDLRSGNEIDVQAYKIAPNGHMCWGPNGISLSENEDFEPTPRVVEATNGDLVFAWQRVTSPTSGSIMLQRLTPGGTPLLPSGGLPIFTSASEIPGDCQIIAADAGHVIVAWLTDLTSPCSTRHIAADKITPNGSSSWGEPATVCDHGTVPIAHSPYLCSDGAGGAVITWDLLFAGCPSTVNGYIQHLAATGAELLPHNGALLSTSTTRLQTHPAAAYCPKTGEFYACWLERDAGQVYCGLYAQKLAPGGQRLWGEEGLPLLPLEDAWKEPPRAVTYRDGLMIYLLEEQTTPAGTCRLSGFHLAPDGSSLFPQTPLILSTPLANKLRLSLATDAVGGAYLAWQDGRTGSDDIYAQNVHPSGLLGVPAPGDFNGDGVINARDLEIFAGCLGGPDIATPPPGGNLVHFHRADLQDDTDVDVLDFAHLQARLR
jgi:hypothetical protein